MRLKTTCRAVAVLVAAALLGNTTSAINVSPPSPVPALSPTQITVDYEAGDKSFIFIVGVVDGAMYLPDVRDAGPGKLVFSGPPGTYAVMGNENGKRIQQTVIVEGSPGPGPTPPPPPPGKRLVVVIWESSNGARPEIAAATQSLQEYCKQKGHVFRWVDKDLKERQPDGSEGTPMWLQTYLRLAQTDNVKLPAYIIVAPSADGSEDKAVVVPFPVEPGKAIEILKSKGG